MVCKCKCKGMHRVGEEAAGRGEKGKRGRRGTQGWRVTYFPGVASARGNFATRVFPKIYVRPCRRLNGASCLPRLLSPPTPGAVPRCSTSYRPITVWPFRQRDAAHEIPKASPAKATTGDDDGNNDRMPPLEPAAGASRRGIPARRTLRRNELTLCRVTLKLCGKDRGE